MVIEKQSYQNILRSLNLGNSVAENDDLLQDARVNTPVFEEFIDGKYDIIIGRKGAGKTAIFRIVEKEYNDFFLLQRKTVILTGVNSSGNTVFEQFNRHFEKYSEQDFENFWKIYIISLVYNDFLKNPAFEDHLKQCGKEIEQFKKACSRAGIPNIVSRQTKREIIQAVVNRIKPSGIKRAHIGITGDPKTGLLGGGATFEFFEKTPPVSVAEQTSVYVNEIGEALSKILGSSNLRVWVMLDRLDEVFTRYSKEEFNGLRGLLKAYRSLDIGDSKRFSIKLFLRDDIKQFLTDGKIYQKFFKGSIPPFAATTHIFSKQSKVLSWSQDEIEMLILNRLLTNPELRDYVRLQEPLNKALQTSEQRLLYWNQIFPEKIGNMPSLKWIYTRLRDSNYVITPRSVIDLLNGAADFQKQNLQVDFKDSSEIFPAKALKYGYAVASENKLVSEIYAEFSHLQNDIKKLSKGKGKLTKKNLKDLYGEKWMDVVENLERVGILRLVELTGNYMVDFLYRPALDIKQQ